MLVRRFTEPFYKRHGAGGSAPERSHKPELQNDILSDKNDAEPTEQEINNKESILKKLEGNWLHRDNSLASVEVNDSWTFKYAGSEVEEGDIFEIEITDSLPDYGGGKGSPGFLLLTNGGDTLHYEILGLDDLYLHLMYYPGGNTHLYKRIK